MRLAIAIAVVVTSTSARAEPPGPLSDAHAQLDGKDSCITCHDAGAPAASTAKCLSCHSAIANGHGLHATPLAANATCGSCHAEHRGRRADITGWPKVGGIAGFDHRVTGYRLLGPHQDTACDKCHTSRDGRGVTRYLKLTQACSSCHRSPHDGEAFFERDCSTCHSPLVKSLKVTHVDHAAFPLGKHVSPKVACQGCHTPLRGAGAADIACERCHKASHGIRFVGWDCTDCHRSATSWLPNNFRHASTGFELFSEHRRLACRQCHRGGSPDEFELFRDAKCTGCHQHKNVHSDETHPTGKYRDDQCLQCHLHPGPPPRRDYIVAAAHGMNGTFPLLNKHRDVPCAECHVTRSAKKGTMTFEHIDPNCSGGQQCHEGDPHKGTLGVTCTTCHVGGTWDPVKFDHDKPFASGWAFPLRGAHADQTCDACHAKRDLFAASVACVSCHANDDVHRGSFGSKCEQCHRDTGEITFDHQRARFKLDGKHQAVACIDCHPTGLLAPRPRTCAGCHPVPAFHNSARNELAWFDNDCAGCHSTRGW